MNSFAWALLEDREGMINTFTKKKRSPEGFFNKLKKFSVAKARKQ